MAVYAIGDIQGCFDQLQQLLELIEFNPQQDRLWFTGDLVNRGPKSLETLRFVKQLGDAAVTVLGNHDLHLLAIAYGPERPRKKDTLNAILDAPDRDALLDWLRHQPLFHHELGFSLLHAGLPPQWDLALTRQCAAEVEAVLRGAEFETFLSQMYGDLPDRWNPQLSGWERMRFITNCFTRLRYCDAEGRLILEEKATPGSQNPAIQPWFQLPGRKSASLKILFGHWSTLNYYQGHNCVCLDSGCLWGGQLTAVRLGEDLERISIDCPCTRTPSR